MPDIQAPPNESFWIVWNPEGRNPSVRHRTEDEATAEAERLAMQNPGKQFFVLYPIEMRQLDALIRVSFDRHPDIPF